MNEAAAPELTPEQHLAALKAKRAALKAASAETDSEATARAIAVETRALADDEARAAARKKYGAGKYAVVEGIGEHGFDIVIVKRPHAAAFKAFQDKEGAKLDDIESLVTPCVVYPQPEIFSKLITVDQPAVLLRCAEAVCYLAGARKSGELGKA